VFQDLAGCLFPVLKVGGHAGTGAEALRGRIDADEDDIVFPDAPGYVRIEEEIPAARLLDDLIQSGFIDRKGRRVPLRDLLFIRIHNGHPVPGTLAGNHGRRRPAHETGANTKDSFFELHTAVPPADCSLFFLFFLFFLFSYFPCPRSCNNPADTVRQGHPVTKPCFPQRAPHNVTGPRFAFGLRSVIKKRTPPGGAFPGFFSIDDVSGPMPEPVPSGNPS